MARLDRRDRVFFKSNGGSFLGLSIAFVIFIVLLALCCTSLSAVTRFGLCLNMGLLSFLINIIFDRFGFYVSFVLSFTQLLIHSYEFLVLKKEGSVDLAVITLLIIIINIIHGLYLSHVLRNIYARKRAESLERTKTITKQMEDDIFARTKLIVSHDPEKQKPAATVSKSPAVDTLTTLPGRRMITDRLNRIIEEDLKAMQGASVPDQACTHLTIIYTSLDETSLDKLHIGHKSMDLFIQNMAHKLREAAEPEDMVARIYGTEFVILAKRVISAEDFAKYKNKLTEAMSAAFRAADEQMNVNFEFGVSMYPDDGTTAEALITKAEEAMTGRITYGGSVMRKSFFSDMDSTAIITMFESAIRSGDFHMVYQPCYLATGELTGYEAFMRWTSDGKNIRPPDFIRAATKCGYIRRIGNYSLEHSLKVLAKINETDPSLKMNINIATEQLKETSFVMEFSNALSNSNAKIENVILDINEESLYTDLPEIKNSIEKLSSMGVNMALDNFGKGYSSFNAIPLMPIRMLKLDGDFTRDLTSDINVRVLVSAAINLMHDIDIKVCATGMGNNGQLELLKEYGCDYFQGSILGVPVDEDKIDLRS